MKTMLMVVIGLAPVSLMSVASIASAADGAPAATLVEEVRRATKPYQDVAAATAAGYALFLGCVSGPQGGAMGIHYVNGDLVGDAPFDDRTSASPASPGRTWRSARRGTASACRLARVQVVA